MKKQLLLLINLLLVAVILTACKSPVAPTVQTPEPIEQTSPEQADQTELEPEIDESKIGEAEDLLNNWYEWKTVSYMPEINKENDGGILYGFLVDYSDGEVEWTGDTYCYAWVNPSADIILFEEAGYLEDSSPNSYSNIPDSIFPIPLRDGELIPYDQFTPPDYVWGVAYTYENKSVMESYKEQLLEAGFVDYGSVQSVESLWQYELPNDEGVFTVEMYSEADVFTMNMYINNH